MDEDFTLFCFRNGKDIKIMQAENDFCWTLTSNGPNVLMIQKHTMMDIAAATLKDVGTIFTPNNIYIFPV